VIEARRYPRTHTRIPLEFTPWDPKHITFGFATDISVGGACVATDFPLPLGTEVVVRMWPLRCDEEAVVPAVVRWASLGQMGVKFLAMGAGARRAIQAVVAEATEGRHEAREAAQAWAPRN
jgi:hypothetical protein